MSQEEAIKRIERARMSADPALDLSDLQLASLPDAIGELSSLQVLSLAGTKLRTLPEELCQLRNLIQLDLRQNRLSALPECLGQLTSLRRLDLGGNRLSSLPESLAQLRSLRVLDLERNRLSTLPKNIGQLESLRFLDLERNQLSALPESLGQLTLLRSIYLEANQLGSLPLSFGRLTSLTTLDIRANQLSALPESLGGLTSLNELDLRGNRLHDLPNGLGKLKSLQTLRLAGNPLPKTVLSLATQGVDELLAYLRGFESNPEHSRKLSEAKLVLVGEGNVGKTCLLRALQGKGFAHQGTTKGMEVARESLPLSDRATKKAIELNAWDFGGQPNYRVTHQFFFSPQSLFLVVWDPRSGTEKCDVEGWISRIRLRVGDAARILIVATHAETGDPPPAVNIDEAGLRKRFGGILTDFFNVDSKTGFGIPELKTALLENARRLPGIGDPIPQRWDSVRQRVEAIAEAGSPWVSRRRFNEECHAAGLPTDQADSLLALLNILGQLVYYGHAGSDWSEPLEAGGDHRLADIIVLRPEWLAKAVCFVLEDTEVKNASGVLKHSDLARIWWDDRSVETRYDKKLHPYFLALMERYETSYRLGDTGSSSSLIPQLIQKSCPEQLPWYPEDHGAENQLSLVAEMDEEPTGLMPLMIVRTHRFSRDNQHWERGAFLDYGRHGTAHLERADRELRISVRGDYPLHFLSLLSDSFEKLVKDVWKGLVERYRLSVPCPARDATGTPCPGRWPLDSLREFLADGDQHIRCQRCRGRFEISQLLHGLSTPGIEISERLDILAQQLDEAHRRDEKHASQMAEMFRTLLFSIHNETARGPGMFLLTPAEKSWKDALRGVTRYHLTLWCEDPEGPHALCKTGSGEPGDYSFDRPAEWLKQAAPFISWTAKILKTAFPLMTGGYRLGLDADERVAIANRLSLMERCVSALPGGELAIPGGMDPGRHGRYKLRPDGASLRDFHDLLEEVAGNRHWGGLERILTKSGDYLWLCPDHRREHEPDLPVLE